jgi:hypothetical protein
MWLCRPSDEQMECQMLDRMSNQRFRGVTQVGFTKNFGVFGARKY